MPWFEFLQPIDTWNEVEGQNPESWEMRMQEPDLEGWPSGELDVSIIDEFFYFDCGENLIENFCAEQLKMMHGFDVTQPQIDYCVTSNLNRCAQVITENLPYENGWLQLRACDEHQISCSEWSKAIVVSEPSFVITFTLMMLCITIFGKMKNKKTPRSKKEQGVFRGQKDPR